MIRAKKYGFWKWLVEFLGCIVYMFSEIQLMYLYGLIEAARYEIIQICDNHPHLAELIS